MVLQHNPVKLREAGSVCFYGPSKPIKTREGKQLRGRPNTETQHCRRLNQSRTYSGVFEGFLGFAALLTPAVGALTLQGPLLFSSAEQLPTESPYRHTPEARPRR